MWRAALVIGAANAFLAPIPNQKHILRAEPRWVDGPTDIGEAGAMSRHTGGAVCVLYFNPMGEGGAWPMPEPGMKRCVVRGARCSCLRLVGGGVFGRGAFLLSADRHQRSSARLKN